MNLVNRNLLITLGFNQEVQKYIIVSGFEILSVISEFNLLDFNMSNGKTRHGSLQFWPSSRSQRFLPYVSCNAISSKEHGLMGFIGYKVGMRSAFVKDNTPNSLTKGKRIIIPVTIIECPTMKILSIRFYKYNANSIKIFIGYSLFFAGFLHLFDDQDNRTLL